MQVSKRFSSSTSFKRWTTKHPQSWFSCNPGKNGFMPMGPCLKELPSKYSKLEELLREMPINRPDGKNGNLFFRDLGERVDTELPMYLSEIKKETDTQLLAGLQRDYTFLASAYSLETSHPLENTSVYGIARDHLPPQISEPLLYLAKVNNVYPWMDYAFGFCLNNTYLQNENADVCDYKSWKPVRMFNGFPSEDGFMAVHTAMVAQTPDLLQEQQNCLEHISNNNRNEFNKSLKKHYRTLGSIVNTLNTMWNASKFSEYLKFRTFIYGQVGNELCYPDQKIKFEKSDGSIELHGYRGETGAQDSIVPSVDNFIELEYPRNKLTNYLYDLRSYRPKDHQEYIDWMGEESKKLKIKEYCMNDPASSIVLLKNLDCLRMFRKKHWSMTKKYIIQNTKHPVATGGTPITTWLPNQLGATLEYMQEVINNININKLDLADEEYYYYLNIEITDHIQAIIDEVNYMQVDFDTSGQKVDEFMKREKVAQVA